MKMKQYRIEDIALISAGGDRPSTCSNVKTKELLIPVYSNGLENDGLYGFTDKAKIEGDTVTVSARGVNVGTVCYRDTPFTPIVRLLALVPKREIVDGRYLYYALKNIPLSGTGSAQPQITVPMISKQQILIHEDPTYQKCIAQFLAKYDAKIQLNKRINENLLEQCQLLYEQMCMDAELSPMSYLIKKIETGSRPKGGAGSFGIPSIGAEKIDGFGSYDYSSEKYISEEFFNKLKRGVVISGDVMLYKDGAYTGKSSMALDEFPHKKCAVNEHVFLLRTDSNYAQFFLYFTLRSETIRQKIYSLACGKAAQPGLNQQELMNVMIKLPDKSSVIEFEKKVAPAMHMIAGNALESRQLANIRDALLPRIMSDMITIPYAN